MSNKSKVYAVLLFCRRGLMCSNYCSIRTLATPNESRKKMTSASGRAETALCIIDTNKVGKYNCIN